MSNLVITIGRQYGSGGHLIGEKLARELDIAFYDKELLRESARRTGLDLSYLERVDEKPSSLLYSLSGGGGGFVVPSSGYEGLSMPDQVFVELCRLVQEIAARESCVIVGRAADYILRDTGAINIFIHASLPHRIQRVMEYENISAAEAEQRIAKADKQRAAYYNHYVGKRWGALTNYQLSIDSGLLGIDGTVELIRNCVLR